MASSTAARSTGTFHTTRLMAICYGLGFLALGLGQGMGWGYLWTPYPAIRGIGIQISGAVLLLTSSLLSTRHRPAGRPTRDESWGRSLSQLTQSTEA